MAQYRLNAYDADVFIPEFRGLYQYGDTMDGDLRNAEDEQNVETIGGVLQPCAKWQGFRVGIAATFGTMMYLRSQAPYYGSQSASAWYKGITLQASLTGGKEYDTFVFSTNGRMYRLDILGDPMVVKNDDYTSPDGIYRLPNPPDDNGHIQKLTLPSDLPAPEAHPDDHYFSTDHWSWCVYEKNYPTGIMEHPVERRNTLLFSNEAHGLHYMDGGAVVKATDAPENFVSIAVYAERVFGCKGSSIFYSKPYSVTDWDLDNDNPERGGGEIMLPTFDKDKFVALVPFADSLIAFTRKRAYRISGSDPTNFYVQEQPGNGVAYPDTIAVLGSRIIFLGEEGLMTYDGNEVAPFMQQATWNILRDFPYDPIITPQAVSVNGRYILTLRTESGTTNIVYNQADGTILKSDVEGFFMSLCKGTDYAWIGHVEQQTVYPSEVARMNYDSWMHGKIVEKTSKWISPWIDFNRNDIKKGGFEFYFLPELEPKRTITGQTWPNISASDYNGEPSTYTETETTGNVTITISIQTEKKAKTKTYTVKPLTDEEIAAGKKHRQKRLHFGGTGRRFRIVIETSNENGIPWRLTGGIQIIAETDAD